MKNNKIAITGSEGLVGGSIVNIFEKKNIKVIKIDKSLGLDISQKKTIDFLNKKKPKVIIHCASHPGGLSNINPVEDVQTNCFGSINIIKWCKDFNAKLIFTSSSAVYGNQPSRKIKENSLLKPGTIYAVNKIAIENWIKILSKIKKFPWSILRLFSTYGAGHKPNTYQGIVNVMLTQIIRSRKIIVKGSLSRERDLIYCKDVSRAIADVLYSKKSLYKTINIGTATRVTINEIIKNIIEVLGYSKNNYDIIVKKDTQGDPMYSIADISLAKKLINFKPKFSLKAGLIDTIKNYNI